MEQKNYQEMLGEALGHFKPDDQVGHILHAWDADFDDAKGVGKAIVGVGMVVGDLSFRAEELNKNLKKSYESSEKLSSAIWLVTLVGAVISGVGVTVAAGNLVWDIYKTLHHL